MNYFTIYLKYDAICINIESHKSKISIKKSTYADKESNVSLFHKAYWHVRYNSSDAIKREEKEEVSLVTNV